MKQEYKKDYEEYITSSKWFEIRNKVFKLLGRKCQKCGATRQLHVHHKTYVRFKNENIETDLTVLCNKCHDTYHKRYKKVSIETTDLFINELQDYKYKFISKKLLTKEQRIERGFDKQRRKRERKEKSKKVRSKFKVNPERVKKVNALKILLGNGKLDKQGYFAELRKL